MKSVVNLARTTTQPQYLSHDGGCLVAMVLAHPMWSVLDWLCCLSSVCLKWMTIIISNSGFENLPFTVNEMLKSFASLFVCLVVCVWWSNLSLTLPVQCLIVVNYLILQYPRHYCATINQSNSGVNFVSGAQTQILFVLTICKIDTKKCFSLP